MEKKQNVKNQKKVKVISSIAVIVLVIVLIVMLIISLTKKQGGVITAELAKAMTYAEVKEGDEIVAEAPNVRFDAFFLRDINNDGYAESLRGTCKEIGSEDTLYMELNVVTAGYLKNAKITINGANFYLQTALPKDDELKDNYIGNNIKTIEFNDIANGTQKMITGIVRSGDYTYESNKANAIGKNINNYSRINSVTLTGTYVNENGQEILINKKVEFNVDWYGTTKASIKDYTKNQNLNIENIIDEEKGVVNLDFNIYTEEVDKKLILSKNHVEGEIPLLNGYEPKEVLYTGSKGIFNYNAETKMFTIDREAVVKDNGTVTTTISRDETYNIRIVYPIEAYQSLGTETVTLKIPVKTYYEGYNNPSEEFTNPYKSNIASMTIVVNYENPRGNIAVFDVTVGRMVYTPTIRYIVSKEKPLKIYNGMSETETNDTYTVLWQAYIGEETNLPGIIMKETPNGETQVTDAFIKSDSTEESTDDVVSNIGIYFSGADTILGENGWIKVYDDETGNFLATFTKDNWNKYNSTEPYKYETPIKHIRIETSDVIGNHSYLYVYNVKEINDEKITGKYEREEFDKLKYIKSTLVGYLGNTFINTDINQANYEETMSMASINISNNTLSTQETEKNDIITITANENTTANQVAWKNGIFLVKLPEEIIDAQINNIEISNTNVALESYELIEQNEALFIKIVTQNDIPQSYNITIDVNLSSDPMNVTATRQIELYASNENGTDYIYKAQDQYDVNNNLNTDENVNYATVDISLIAPNSLLTSQIATNYDDKGSKVVSPQIADMKPIYATVDQQQEEKTATIGVQIRNNYASTISEIQIIGKIPFEGNTYVLNGGDLGSTFTTKMLNTGITIPEELQQYAKIYYSENENPTNNINEASNGWKTTENVTNWDNIRTYLINLENYVMPMGKEYVFNYTVKIPNGLEFNEVSYSHHGVYFSLDTDEGKYRTQVEPNRLGLRIAEKFDLEITKYQTGRDKGVEGATYSITEVNTNEAGEEIKGEARTGVTNTQGKLIISNLYVEKIYEMIETKSSDDYELNSDVIRFISHVDEEGNLTIEKLQGTIRGNITVTKDEEKDYKVGISIEDEVKARLKITKKEQGTENAIKGIRFKITGYGLPESGRNLTTNIDGEISVNGLSIGQEYTVQEVKAEGYYLANTIKFKVVNEEGRYKINFIEGADGAGAITSNEITEEDSIPTINLKIVNEKIPTYDLQITKIQRTVESIVSENNLIERTEINSANSEVEYLEGAKFKLYKGTEEVGEYITDGTGTITMRGLYQYVSEKGIDQTYKLKEVLAPDGYAKVKDITFKVEEKEGKLVFTEINEEGEEIESTRYTTEGGLIKLTLEDSPSFKLIKKDAETKEVLANIKFALYNVDDGTEQLAKNSKGEILGTKEIINGKEYYVVETNENGEITAALTEGLYKAVEVQADEKYDLVGQIYYFGIGASREPASTIIAKQAQNVGGSDDDEILSVSNTDDGGYIAIGEFSSSSITIGKHILSNSGSTDIFIIKYSQFGEVDWATKIGESDTERAASVAQTADGGYIVAGYYWGSNLTIGNYILNNTSEHTNGFIAKYNNNGQVQWVRNIGGNGEYDGIHIYTIAATNDGGCIIGGSFNYGLAVGGYNFTINGTSGMIIKYSNNGDVQLATLLGYQVLSVDGTSDGGWIVGGYFYNNITAGDHKLTSSGENDGMIIKYNSSRQVEWATNIGGSGYDYVYSVTEASNGGYIVGGSFNNNITVGSYNLTSIGSSDGILVKYSSNGEPEWATNIGDANADNIRSVSKTADGGYIVGGEFKSESIIIGDYTLENNNDDYTDIMVIKYSTENQVEWAANIGGILDEKIVSVLEISDGTYIVGGYFESSSIIVDSNTIKTTGGSDGMLVRYETIEVDKPTTLQAQNIGGNSSEQIKSVIETTDGGYIVGGYFQSSSITVDGMTLNSLGSADGMIVKYNGNGKVEWATNIGGSSSDYITSIAETSDGGYIVGGYFQSTSIKVGDYTLTRVGNYDGMVIKYNSEGEVEWATSIGGSRNEYIYSVAETLDEGVIVGGNFDSSSITIGDYTLINAGSTNYTDGMVIKYNKEGQVEWATSIQGSDDEEISSVSATNDGGAIIGGYFDSDSITINGNTLTNSGSYGSDAMIIKYSSNGKVDWIKTIGGSSYQEIKSILVTSDGGFILGGQFNSSNITVDGYTLTRIGGYDGMVIKYSKQGQIDWVASIGGSSSEYINSVAETSDGGYIIGGYYSSDTITIGNYPLINNGSNEGLVIKYSSDGEVEWAKGIGGASSDCINSVIEANNGEYIAVGYFNSSTIETDENILTNAGSSDGMILKIVNQVGVPEVQELTVENNRKELKITTDIEEIDGVKGGSISGEDQNPYETVKYGNSSINTIKMTPSSGYEIIKITINGEELSDYKIASDGSYTLPSFSNMTEDKHIVVTYVKTSNKLTIIKKDAKDGTLLSGAKFELTQIIEDGEPYTETLETKKNGETATQIPYGQYTITEIEAPEGYEALKESITIQFSSSGISVIENNNGVDVTVGANGELVIENNQTAKVIVHHYLKTEDGTYTTTKVAEDEMLEGKIGDKYVAIPHLDLEKYQLEKDAEGNYVVPGTATGQFKEEVQEVIYYYEVKDIPLIVHHYIEGTEDRVPLSDESLAEDEEFAGKEGEQYTTDALTEKELNEKYELVERPENATGTYEGNSIEVIYYYKIKVVEITSRVEGEGGSISGEKEKPYEEVEYGEDSLKDIIAVPEEGYRVSKITVNGEEIAFTANEDGTVELDKFIEMKEDKEVVVSFEKIPGQVIVHHYIYNKETGEYTTNKVPSKQGGVVEDEIKTGVIGDIYASKISENVSQNYEYVSSTNNTSGKMTEETIEVIYYYQIKEGKITENTIEKTGTDKITQEDQEVSYTINYKAILDEYIGNAEITIIDKLPYEIDEKKSNILGGVYNAAEKTITWVEKVENIDTYTNGAKEINISKNITVVYVNMDYSKTNFENTTQGTIVLEETKQEENTPESKVTTETEFVKQVEVTKVWEHTNNIYGIPEEVKIQVKNGTDVVAEKVLNNSNKTVEDENIWKWTFTGLPKYNSQGQEINYTVDEVNEGNLNYYKKEIDGTTIKNTYNGPVITANKEVATENSLSYVVEGEKITYTIRVQNSGDLATDVLVKDNIPEGTSFVEESIKINGVEDTSKTATDLTNGIRINVPARTDENTPGKTTISFEVMVNVLEGNILTKNITNIAAVNKNPNNPASPDEPTNEVTTTVNKPDLKYNKSSNPTSGSTVKVGDEIIYTIHLDNITGTAPISAVVKDNIPSGTTFVEGSIKVGGQAQQTMTSDDLINGINVDLGVGESKDVEFKVTVNDLDNGTKIKNVATVNNEPTNETEHTYVEAIITANKEATTENNLSYVVEGEKITYTIRVQNRGDLAQDVVIKDTIPEGTSFVEGSIKINGVEDTLKKATDLTNGIRVNVPERQNETTPGETTVSFEVTVNVLEGNTLTKDITNIATVNKEPDKPGSPDESTNEVTITVNKPDLKYSKSSNPTSGSTVKVGNEITYTIHLDNTTGTAPISAVVKDNIPSGTTFVEGSIKVGGQLQEGMTAENLVSGINVDLQAGESKDIEFKVTVNDLDNGVIIRNTATVNDEPTNETEHTYVEAIITANKEATTENNINYVVEGEKITYTIRLQNRGDLATDVVVKDNIPEGTSFVEGSIKINGVEDTPKTATDLTNGIRVNVPARESETIPREITVSFEVTVNVLEGNILTKDITNTATVNKQPDKPDSSDEPTNEVITTVNKADLKYSKSSNPTSESTVKVGDEITYTIHLDNKTGTAPIRAVVKDSIPSGTTFVEGSIKVGGQTQQTITAENLVNGINVDLGAGESKDVEFKVTVNDLDNGTKIKNVATVNDKLTNETEHTYVEAIIRANKEMKTEKGLGYVIEGEKITYTIRLQNSGDLATDVLVKDNIPEGTRFIEGSIKVDGVEDTLKTATDLTNGIRINVPARIDENTSGKTTISFEVTVNVLEGNILTKNITNIATVNKNPNNPASPDEPTNEVITTVNKSDLKYNKSSNPTSGSTVKVGNEITYTIHLDNRTGTAPTRAVVKDSIPSGTTFVEGSIKVEGQAQEGMTAENLVSGINVDLQAGESKDIEFKVTVNDLDNGVIIRNVATVNDEPTNETEHTCVEAIITANKEATTENNLSYVVEGEKITYTIRLQNSGDLAADVVVKDNIPEGVTFIEKSIKVGKQKQEEMTSADLLNGIRVNVPARQNEATPGETTVSFEVTVNDLDNGAKIRNVATVNDKPTNETEHTYIEAIITANKEATTENNLSYVIEGEKITYTIRLQNRGDLAADVVVKDNIPEGTSFVEGSIKINGVEDTPKTATDLTNGIRVNVPARQNEITPGETTVCFEVTVNDLDNGAKIRNTATVNDEPTNETEHTYVEAIITANKEATTENNLSYVVEGEKITYTIRLQNSGDLAQDVLVKDSIPEGSAFVEGSIKVGEQAQEGMTSADLSNGIRVNVPARENETTAGEITVTFEVTVNSLPDEELTKDIRNTATINKQPDKPESPDEPTNEVTTTVNKSDLKYNKSSNPTTGSTVKVGDEITYTIHLDNRTGTAPTSVLVKDNIPEGTTFVEGSIKVGGQTQQTMTAENLASGINVDLVAGESKEVEFKVTVNDLENGAIIRNVATVNNEPTNETEHTYVEAIITAKKEVKTENSLSYVIEGEKITYTIKVQNSGDLATDVLVKDNIPEGTTFVEGSIKVGEQTQEGMTSADLSNGIRVNVPARENENTPGEITVSFEVTVNVLERNILTKDIKNTATVNKQPDKPDSPDEPTNEVITTVNKSDLKYNKSSNPTSGSTVKVGDEITYTIHLDNRTGTAPTRVVVKDSIPSGTTFVEGSIKVGGELQERMTAENLVSGINVDLGAGESKDVEFKVTVNDLDNGAMIRNGATVNDEATNETEHTYIEAIITANKEATTENNLSYVVKGEKITYTIRLQNSGDLAQDVLVKDSIPEGSAFVEGSIKVGEQAQEGMTSADLSNGIRVNVPARENETTAGEITVTFEVTVNSLPDEELTKDIRNTATINKQPDKPESPDEPTNEVITTVNKSDLKYNKLSNPTSGSTVKVGDEITYTIQLDNTTGTAPTSVLVKDTIPNGTTFVEGSIKVGVLSQLGMTAENLANGISVDLGAGESKDVEFKVTVNDLDNGAKIRNIATVNDEPTKETEHTYVEAIIRANKEMKTEKGLGYVIEGEKITYTIRVQNSGDLAQDVLVKDSIPEGSAFVEGSIKVGEQSQGEMTATDLSNGIKVNVPARKSETTPGEITVSFEVKVNNIGEETSKTIRNTGYVNKEPDKPESPDEPTNEVTVPVLIYKKTAEIIRNGEINQSGNNNITEGAVTAGDRIKYTITINNIGEEAIRNVKVKDTVPEGTTIYVINDNGSISLNDKNEITWNIEQIATGEEKQVSFEVTVKYDTKEKIIKNTGTVDGKETNEVETPYEVPKSDLESNIVKDGSEKITSTEEKISYTIEYKAEVREFIGKGKLKIIDYLPYEIDEANSELNGGTYNKQSKTITWEEDLGEINTYANGDGTKEIERTKRLTLKYMYPNVENLSGTIGNRAEGTITLTQDNITVKEETKEDTHEVKVEVPTVVIVHHYIYDESKGGETTEKVPSREGGKVADEEINGLVGQRYDTNPSNKINENYECINVTPDKHEGTMTKTPIEVTYYYKLKEVELGAIIDKTATANKQEELEYETGEYDEQGQPITAIKTVQVLTSENGVVTYKIKFRAGIKDYKGKATITIIDKLPASLDEEDSRIELSGGTYDATKKTITWEEEIQVDTFATGAIYDQTFEKEIKVVYKDQRVTETLVNTAEGTITIYYPEEHSTKLGEERDSVTVTETAEVEQEYKVAKEVEKVWDDNNNIKGNRPRSVTIQLKANGSTYYNGEQLEKVVLSDANNWKYTFTDLPKYTENGQEIKYSVVETETNLGDLEYYDVPVITEIDNKITVTNKYKLINTRLESSIEKTGTDKITASKEEVTYNINYKVTVTDYIGEALVRIVDTLPYELAKQVDGIDLAGGTYDENTRTITWEERIGHINTYTKGDYEIEINKTIKVVYANLDATKKGMTNTVKGTIDLYETEKTNTVEDTHNTTIEIPGKVIVKYIDKETGNEIADGYEINGMAGDMYATTQKQIPGYTYVENTNNTRGNMIEGTIEVKYYYERTIAGGVLVTYVDENGNKIAKDETYEGKVGDSYKTEQKEIEGYEFVRVEGNTEGELTEGVIKVEYVYKKIPAKVIVRYLEKDDTEDDSDNKVLETEEIISGYVGDSYITNRKEIKNYKSAEPEPENKQGIMTKEDIYVTYYYEKIPSGKVISQYVDIDTKEEILYKDEETGEYKTYEEESKGYIGDRYQTEQKDIPYYKIVEELIPTNKEGEYTAEDIYVTYYYEKLAFNIGVDKNVAKIEINGKEQKVLNGKLNKIEVVARQINNTEVKITYSIKVSNTGELKGTAKLLENIPENFNINEETGKEWTKNVEGNLEANVELQAGETKELKVVLNWIKGENNFGTQKNTVEIVEIANPANYEETTTEDNKSEAEVVMGIRTGDIIKTITTISAWTGMVIAIIIFLYLSNKYIKLHKEKDMK